VRPDAGWIAAHDRQAHALAAPFPRRSGTGTLRELPGLVPELLGGCQPAVEERAARAQHVQPPQALWIIHYGCQRRQLVQHRLGGCTLPSLQQVDRIAGAHAQLNHTTIELPCQLHRLTRELEAALTRCPVRQCHARKLQHVQQRLGVARVPRRREGGLGERTDALFHLRPRRGNQRQSEPRSELGRDRGAGDACRDQRLLEQAHHDGVDPDTHEFAAVHQCGARLSPRASVRRARAPRRDRTGWPRPHASGQGWRLSGPMLVWGRPLGRPPAPLSSTLRSSGSTLEQPGLFACYEAAARGLSVSGERAGRPALRLVVGPGPVPGTDRPTDGREATHRRGGHTLARRRGVQLSGSL